MGESFFERFIGACVRVCRNDPEDPILKSNYKPVFAIPLTECERSERNDGNESYDLIPKLVVECITVIEKDENIKKKGIYRNSAAKSEIDEVKHSVWWTKSKIISQY